MGLGSMGLGFRGLGTRCIKGIRRWDESRWGNPKFFSPYVWEFPKIGVLI